MVQHMYVPPPPLSHFVGSFCLSDGAIVSHAREWVLPTGTVELVINLCDSATRGFDAVICGPHSTAFVLDTAQKTSTLSVHFKPGGAFPFLKVPASALHNTIVSLDALWGTAAGHVREQVLAAFTPAAKFRILEQFLLDQATQPLARHAAVAAALQVMDAAYIAPPHTIAGVAASVGFGERRLRQMFSDQVGLSPKRYWQIQRFQTALRLIEEPQASGWADLALECGYFDQAHFIHDFRTFSGLAPTVYLAQRGARLNHLPLLP